MCKSIGCRCNSCIKACRTETCQLLPYQLKTISEYLRITEQELIDRFLVDNDIDEVGALQPVFIRLEDGKYGCVFHYKGYCTIHDVKPIEGARNDCKTDYRDAKEFRGYIAEEWGKYWAKKYGCKE